MLDNEIIENLNEKELRSYLHLTMETSNKRGCIMYAQDRIIDTLYSFMDNNKYKNTLLSDLSKIEAEQHVLENQLREKYKKYVQDENEI